jgi:predicted  nucleic acid-binding Zn-ribbon protein
MGTLNDIFKKLEDKTELSSHQVELATVFDDVSGALTEMRNLNIKSDQFKKTIDDKKIEVKKAQNDFKEHLSKIEFQIKLANASSDRLKMEASKLGIPVPDLAKNAPKIAKDFERIIAMDKKSYTI